MPYCCQCGKQTRKDDRFCAVCGSPQPPDGKGVPPPSPGMSPRTASALCYVPLVGWIAAVAVLASRKFRDRREVRFHAFQGIYLFVVWLLVDWVIGPMNHLPFWGPVQVSHHLLGVALKILILGAWVFMLVKTSQDETYKLPILGELAERSVSEQKG
jgi:uncharacterized membrane protein